MFYLADPFDIINIEEKTEVKEGFAFELDGYDYEYDRSVYENGEHVHIFDNTIGTFVLFSKKGAKVYGLTDVDTKKLDNFVIENDVLYHVTRGIGKYRTYRVANGMELTKTTKAETDIKKVIMVDAHGSLVCSDDKNQALIITKDDTQLAKDYGIIWQTCVPFWE